MDSRFTSSRAASRGMYIIPVLALSLLVFDGFIGASVPDSTGGKAPEPAHLQVTPDLSPVSPSSTRQHHARLGTDDNTPRLSPGYPFFAHQPHPYFRTGNIVPSSSSGSIEDIANVVHDERQTLAVLHQPPERMSSGHRRCRRASAVNVEGILVDRDDLYIGAGQGGGTISVHECQWAISSNPCGMWLRYESDARRLAVPSHFDGPPWRGILLPWLQPDVSTKGCL